MKPTRKLVAPRSTKPARGRGRPIHSGADSIRPRRSPSERGRGEDRDFAPGSVSASEGRVIAALAAEYALPGNQARLTIRLGTYLDELLKWNRDSNLVAHGDLGRLASRHLAESLAVLRILDPLAPKRLIDVGSGAGFPGMALKLARPDLHVTLIESRRRKGLFLMRVAQELALEGIEVLIARTEHVGAQGIALADVATARAVAKIDQILPWLSGLVRPGGRAVLFKGSSYRQELKAWEAAGNSDWAFRESVPLPDKHLYFAIFERLSG